MMNFYIIYFLCLLQTCVEINIENIGVERRRNRAYGNGWEMWWSLLSGKLKPHIPSISFARDKFLSRKVTLCRRFCSIDNKTLHTRPYTFLSYSTLNNNIY
jgi:hypothetical protein